MATSFETSGDTITSKMQNDAQAYKLPEITQDLMDAHAHRPGLFQEDLAKVNEELHNSGVLPGFDIIGIDGKDLIARGEDGKTALVDTNNPENLKEISTATREQEIGSSGRVAELAEDGSGKYSVVSGDNCWRVANDILTAQGTEAPTDNQIANYIKELEQHNGRSFDQLQIGDEINIPPMVQGGDTTAFTEETAAKDDAQGFTYANEKGNEVKEQPEASTGFTYANEQGNQASDSKGAEAAGTGFSYANESGNAAVQENAAPVQDNSAPITDGVPLPVDTVNPDVEVQNLQEAAPTPEQIELKRQLDLQVIEKQVEYMNAGFGKAMLGSENGFNPMSWFGGAWTSQEEVQRALDNGNLTDDEHKGLLLIQENYDAIKDLNDGFVHRYDFDRWKEESEANLQ